MECSICLDDICVNANSMITECGHRFHTSCIMKHAAYNGFNCPNCRAEMAEEPDLDDESDDYEDDGDDFIELSETEPPPVPRASDHERPSAVQQAAPAPMSSGGGGVSSQRHTLPPRPGSARPLSASSRPSSASSSRPPVHIEAWRLVREEGREGGM